MHAAGWLAYLQWACLPFFLIPLVELALMAAGHAHARWGYAVAPDKFRHLIIQITTVGREPELVRDTIATIRGYALPLSYEIWVVLEPGHDEHYPLADRVITVPADFSSKGIDKARALEYSRLQRSACGLNSYDTKILFVDDDTLPTRAYVMRAYAGDYDLCQGVTVVNRQYATGPWRHFLLCHFDNIRTRNCLIYCSCTQGITGKPLFVHGEGLCVTGLVEDKITWDHPIVASDDLVFGTKAAYAGFSWGYFSEHIQLVSPWTFRDAWRQRKRWTWGNFTAIRRRDILPLSVAVPKGAKYALGVLSVFASGFGAVCLAAGFTKVPPPVHAVFWTSLACWVGSYALMGWINSGGEANADRFARSRIRFVLFRVTQVLVAALLCVPTAVMPAFVIIGSAVTGKPRRFVTIAKTRQATAAASERQTTCR
ncbi:glycosyltransferase [Nonomuraea sp. NN258]|uniref:glycosyltransferase family 2 protein n=1 Tax=Nonomuraea antri TaxID=2730852 RepID=UPI001568D776|nr:glycosyltransferase family 2 protein [Nonomuraea antri]NRQ38196.1 glycosyltransferase [Nonomuraea antri]